MLRTINAALDRAAERSRTLFWTLFRMLSAAMFATHGYAKLLDYPPQPFRGSGITVLSVGDVTLFPIPFGVNLLFVAGLVELAGGALLLIGLWTRWAALAAALTMVMAYLIAHPAWFPTLNNGELAAMYAVAFLALFACGPGPLSADAALAAGRRGPPRK